MAHTTKHFLNIFKNHITTFVLIVFFIISCFSLRAGAEDQNLQNTIEAITKSPFPSYVDNKLKELSNSFETLEKNFIITSNEEDSLHELIRILKETNSSYQALNHHVYGWNTTLEYLYRSNVEAVKRGVSVSRTFIISNDVLQNENKLQMVLQIMERQKKDGINVYYGLRSKLELELRYHPFVLMDVGLSDEKVFARVTAISLKGPQPAGHFITWDKGVIKNQNPFPYLQQSPHIHPFNEETAKSLKEISARMLNM